jgi:hypothetical protein
MCCRLILYIKNLQLYIMLCKSKQKKYSYLGLREYRIFEIVLEHELEGDGLSCKNTAYLNSVIFEHIMQTIESHLTY